MRITLNAVELNKKIIFFFIFLRILAQQAELYIENIRKKYGSFRYAETKTPLDPKALKHHIEKMIPGINDRRDKDSKIFAETDQCKVADGEDIDYYTISSDTEEESSDEHFDKSATQNICKDLIIILSRIDESQTKVLKRKSNVSDDAYDRPTPKKVRFRDEYGDDLCQVQIYEPTDFEHDLEEINAEVNETESMEGVEKESDYETGEKGIENETEKLENVMETKTETGEIETEQIESISEDVESEQTECEDAASELITLPESNHASSSNIPVDPLDYSHCDVAQSNAQAAVDAPHLESVQCVQSAATPREQCKVAWEKVLKMPEISRVSSNQYVGIDDSMEHSAYHKLMESMKGIQRNLLKSIHMGQLRTEALNSHLMSSKEAHVKEIAALQAQNAELMKCLEAAEINAETKRNEVVKQSNAMKEDHQKEIVLLNDTYNHELQELRKQLVGYEQSVENILDDRVNREQKLNQKYRKIIEKMRKESERKLSEKLQCKGCEKALVFCSPLCEQMW